MLRSSSHLQLMADDCTAPPRPANWGPGRATWLSRGHRAHYRHSDTQPQQETQGALYTSALHSTSALDLTLQHYSQH